MGLDNHTEVWYNVVEGKIEGGRGGVMGVDLHEKRRVNGTADRNPGYPVSTLGSQGRQIPLWVQKKIKGATQRRWREAVYARRYLGGDA